MFRNPFARTAPDPRITADEVAESLALNGQVVLPPDLAANFAETRAETATKRATTFSKPVCDRR